MFKWLSIYLATSVLVNPITSNGCHCYVESNGSPKCTGTPTYNGRCDGHDRCYTRCYCHEGLNKWCTSNGGCIGKNQPCVSDCNQPGRSFWCEKLRTCVPNSQQCCYKNGIWRGKKWCEKSKSCIPKDQICECLEDYYFCDKAKVCIRNNEVCEHCKTGEIMCTLPSSYTESFQCYSPRNFNANRNILKACPNGICRKYTDCEENLDDCLGQTFRCGEECKPVEDFIYYRTCQGRCIRRNETCTKNDIKVTKSDSKNMILIIGLGVGGPVVICIIISVLVYAVILKKKRKEILYVDQNSVYGETGDGEYEMNEIMDSNDYYGADDESE